MAFPVYEASSSIAAGVDFGIEVPYPSGISANDILIVQLLDADDDSFIVPDGWEKVNELTSSNASFAWMWKRATGQETGTLNINSVSDTGALVAGIMHRYSGCKTTGVPFESVENAGVVASQSVDISAVTTLGNERLVICLLQLEAYLNTSFPSGYSLGYGEGTQTGTGCVFACFWQQVDVAQTISAQTITPTNTCYWATFSFALIPGTSDYNKQISSSVHGDSIVQASLNVVGKLNALVNSVSTLSATISTFVKGLIETIIIGNSIVQASLNVLEKLNALVNSVSTLSATISTFVKGSIETIIVGNSKVQASISLKVFLAASFNCSSIFKVSFYSLRFIEEISGRSFIKLSISQTSLIELSVNKKSLITREIYEASQLKE